MEKIISFLIVFGVAALFEFIKDRKKKADQSRADNPIVGRTPRSPRRRNVFSRADGMDGVRELLDLRIPDSPVPTQGAAMTAMATPPSKAESRVASSTQPHSKRSFLPGESHHRPLVAEQLQDEAMELVSLPDLPDVPDRGDSPDDRRLAEHYDRWRRAIIDTTILTPRHSSLPGDNI